MPVNEQLAADHSMHLPAAGGLCLLSCTASHFVQPAGVLGFEAYGGLQQVLIVFGFCLQKPGGAARADRGPASSVDDSDGRSSQEDSQAVLQRGTGSAGAAAVAAGAEMAGQDQKTPAKQGD